MLTVNAHYVLIVLLLIMFCYMLVDVSKLALFVLFRMVEHVLVVMIIVRNVWIRFLVCYVILVIMYIIIRVYKVVLRLWSIIYLIVSMYL